MTQITDLEVIEEMELRGGSFVRALAAAARYADPINLAKIKAAWPEYWEAYRSLVEHNHKPDTDFSTSPASAVVSGPSA